MPWRNDITQHCYIVTGDYIQALHNLIAPAAAMGRQQISLIITRVCPSSLYLGVDVSAAPWIILAYITPNAQQIQLLWRSPYICPSQSFNKTRLSIEGERLGYLYNPHSLKKGIETLCPHAIEAKLPAACVAKFGSSVISLMR